MSKVSVVVILLLIILIPILLFFHLYPVIGLLFIYVIPLIYVIKWVYEDIAKHPDMDGSDIIIQMIGAVLPGVNMLIFISLWGEGNKL